MYSQLKLGNFDGLHYLVHIHYTSSISIKGFSVLVFLRHWIILPGIAPIYVRLKRKTKEEKTLFMFITKLLFSYNSAKILMYVQLSILHMLRKEYHNHENRTTYAAMITKFSAPLTSIWLRKRTNNQKDILVP